MAIVASDTVHDHGATSAPYSVLRALNEVSRRLERVLLDLRTQPNPDTQLRELAHEVINAVERNPNIALACIYLNQLVGIYAVRHCVETAIVAVVVARAMGKTPDEVLIITAAALTMNVGMVRHTERFQNKGSDLTAEERSIIARHPEEGADLLRCAGVEDPQWIEYVLLHHENEDGSGYPEGRQGAEIPQNAKLIGLADRYCACVSARNYRRSMSPHAAMQLLFTDAKVVPDERLARYFIEKIGVYPPGTLVRLQNGEIGVVSQRLDSGGTVQVHTLRDADGKALAPPVVRRSIDPHCAIEEGLHEDQAGLRFSMKHIWGEQAAL